jgi:hypothetical protein
MKYLLILIICAGAYYGYSSKASTQAPANELTYIELLKHIKTEDVKASILFNAAHKSAVDGCYDAEWLKMRGSNTQACKDKLKAFKSICAERIFPDLNKVIKGYNSSNKLLLRYSECTGV